MISKNTLKVLEFREEILDTEPMEIKHGIKLPPIFKSFYSVFKPYFSVEYYISPKNNKSTQFTRVIYSSLKLDSYTIEEDEFAFDSFKELEEMLTFEPNNKDHLKELLFISNHGCWGGLMVGIGAQNNDKIFTNSGAKPVTFIANNILS
jgi:hypothetical protein